MITNILLGAGLSMIGYIGIQCIKWLKKIDSSVGKLDTHISVQEEVNENLKARLTTLERK